MHIPTVRRKPVREGTAAGVHALGKALRLCHQLDPVLKALCFSWLNVKCVQATLSSNRSQIPSKASQTYPRHINLHPYNTVVYKGRPKDEAETSPSSGGGSASKLNVKTEEPKSPEGTRTPTSKNKNNKAPVGPGAVQADGAN